MFYSVGSQIAYSIAKCSISPYISNTLKDHKTPLEEKGNACRGQALIQLYTAYQWIASVYDVCLWVMLEVQYILPALMTDLMLTFLMSREYFKEHEVILPD